jgi:hypothetical protein
MPDESLRPNCADLSPRHFIPEANDAESPQTAAAKY